MLQFSLIMYFSFCCSSHVLLKVSVSVVALDIVSFYVLLVLTVCAVTCFARGFGVIFGMLLSTNG